MIINRIGAEFVYEGDAFVIGQPVVGTSQSEYEGLYGLITEIRDGKDKETENDMPDIYCAFDPPVLPHDIEELEKRFSSLYQNPKKLEGISLDEVIMAPEMVKVVEVPEKCRRFLPVYIVVEDWARAWGRGHEGFIDGEYDKNHYLIQIGERRLAASEEFIKRVSVS